MTTPREEQGLVRLRFGVFEIDAQGLELRRDGRAIPIQPRPAKVLATLAEAQGRIVTHEELRRRVWGEHALIDVDQSLKTCVKQIRAVLADDAREPQYVETLPRRGYRFLAPVQVLASEPAKEAPSGPTRRPQLPRQFAAAATLAVCALGLVAASAWLHRLDAGRNASPDPTGSAHPETPAAELDSDSPAYPAWLQARRLLATRDLEDLSAAVHLLRDAEQLDPTFAPAVASLALAYTDLSSLPAADRYTAAKAAAERALELDPSLAEAYLARGRTRFWYDWDWAGAREDFDTAIARAPELPAAHRALASWLAAMGRTNQALQAIDRALELDPSCGAARADRGWFHYFARRYDDAIRDCSVATRLDENHRSADYCVLVAALASDQIDRALQSARHRMLVNHEPPALIDAFDTASPEEALRLFVGAWLQALDRIAPVSAADRTLPLLIVGEHARALDSLEQAYGEHTGWFLPFLRVAPFLDPLRDEPRFRTIEALLRFP